MARRKEDGFSSRTQWFALLPMWVLIHFLKLRSFGLSLTAFFPFPMWVLLPLPPRLEPLAPPRTRVRVSSSVRPPPVRLS